MLSFYFIKKSYVDFLRTVDEKVPTLDYETHDKFFCGIVLSMNGINYYVPVSHEIKKQQTNIIIKDKGRPISSLKFSFMIPAPNSVLSKLDFKMIAQNDINYANLLRAEYEYCSKNRCLQIISDIPMS